MTALALPDPKLLTWPARDRAARSCRRYLAELGQSIPVRVVYVAKKPPAERKRPLRDKDIARCGCGAWRVKGDDCATCAVLMARVA